MECHLLTDDIIIVAIVINLFISIVMFIVGMWVGSCDNDSKYLCMGMFIAHFCSCILWACLFAVPTVSENSESLIRLFIDI